jgi:hypothetical protein
MTKPAVHEVDHGLSDVKSDVILRETNFQRVHKISKLFTYRRVSVNSTESAAAHEDPSDDGKERYPESLEVSGVARDAV